MRLLPINKTILIRKMFTSPVREKIVPKNLKGKSKSSQEWLTRQLNDPYVKKAHDLNYRARSAFKLIEMDDKLKLLKPGVVVVECGAAPGAWTQVIVQRINSDGKNQKKPVGKVIGIDLLPIDPLPGAILLPGCDFTSQETLKKIADLLQNCGDPSLNSQPVGVDIILSDMAPNSTGMHGVDHPRIITLVREALKFATQHGKVGSHFVTKIWDGSETKELEKELESAYHKVGRLKPPSSRADSAEVFLFAKGKKKI